MQRGGPDMLRLHRTTTARRGGIPPDHVGSDRGRRGRRGAQSRRPPACSARAPRPPPRPRSRSTPPRPRPPSRPPTTPCSTSPTRTCRANSWSSRTASRSAGRCSRRCRRSEASAAQGAKIHTVKILTPAQCAKQSLPSQCAHVVYDILGTGGTAILPNNNGYAVYTNGHWLVSKVTICTLLGLFYTAEGETGSPPGC